MQQIKLFTDSKISLTSLNRPYFLLVYSRQHGSFVPGEQLQRLHFTKGQLRLDRDPILQPKFRRNSVSWKQKTAKYFTAGHLLFSKDGLTAYGTITYGSCPKTATLYTVVATAVPSTAYTTQITKQRYPAGTDPNALPADAWQPGLALQLGYHDYSTARAVHPRVQFDQNHTMSAVALSLTKNQVKVSFSLDTSLNIDADSLPSPNSNLYTSGQLVLSQSGNTFGGTISQTYSDRSTNSDVYLWKGSAAQPQSDTAEDIIQLNSADLLQDNSLNVNELMTLLPNETVTQLSHSMLVENMKWAVAKDPNKEQWLGQFFQQNPPVLDPNSDADRISLINQNLDWYQTDFAVPYLAEGMSIAPDPATPPPIQLDDTQKAKLDYYLKSGLAQSKEYNVQSDGIYTQAYLVGQQGLKAYIQDGGEKWAAQLFTVLTTPDQLAQAMARLSSEFDMTLTNNNTTLLSVLDPSGNYAKQYQNALFGRLTLETGLFGTTIKDETITLNWLPDALTKLASSAPSSATFKATATSADDFNQAVSNINDAFTYFGDATETAKAIYDAISLAKGYSLAQKLENAEAAFTKQYPTLSGVGKLFAFLAWVGGVFNTAIGFMNWKTEDGPTKGTVITNCVSLVLSLAQAGIDLLNPFVEGSMQALENAMSELERLNGVIDDIIAELAPADAFEAAWRLEAVTNALELVDQEGQKLVTPAFWENVFSTATTVIKVFAVAVTAATLVLNVIDLVQDIKNGKPVQELVLEGLMAGVTFGTLIIQIIDLAVEAVVCTVLSAVFALLGIVLTIIELFLPQPKEPTPAETFQQNYGNSYINTLPSPPASSPPATERPLPNVKLIYNLA